MIAVTDRLAKFYKILVNKTYQQQQALGPELDPLGMVLLSYLLSTERVFPGASRVGGKLFGTVFIAKDLNLGRWVVTARLKVLAMFGIITVHIGKSDAVSNHKLPCEIVINPVVERLLTAKGCNAVEMQQVVNRLVRIGGVRAESLEALQGFKSHVPYGEDEPQRLLTDGATDDGVCAEERDLFGEASAETERAHRLETDKERAKREKAEMAARANKFIEVSAEIWQRGQIAYGRMNPAERVAPNWWAADPRQLVEVLRKEYKCLESMWMLYGTIRVGMAWRYFNGQAPLKDAKDRVQFIPDIPHIQWSSLDKKPTHFAKHLNALFCDPVFRNWLEDEARLAKVRGDYGEELCAWEGNEEQPTTGGKL